MIRLKEQENNLEECFVLHIKNCVCSSVRLKGRAKVLQANIFLAGKDGNLQD